MDTAIVSSYSNMYHNVVYCNAARPAALKRKIDNEVMGMTIYMSLQWAPGGNTGSCMGNL